MPKRKAKIEFECDCDEPQFVSLDSELSFYELRAKRKMPVGVEKALTGIIKKQVWTEAKTFRKTAPHEYFLDFQNRKGFKTFVKAIAEFGREELFKLSGHPKIYRYLYLGGYRYWRDENVLNRVKASLIVRKNGVSMQRLPGGKKRK